MSWLHPLTVFGEKCATASDGRNIFQQVAWCIPRMFIQDRTQHRGKLILCRTRSRRQRGSGSDIVYVHSWLAVCCPTTSWTVFCLCLVSIGLTTSISPDLQCTLSYVKSVYHTTKLVCGLKAACHRHTSAGWFHECERFQPHRLYTTETTRALGRCIVERHKQLLILLTVSR